MFLNLKYLSLCIVIVALIHAQKGKAFNLSPKPNLVLQEPPNMLRGVKRKIHSSYFGFSINLKHDSIFIGAPRAQATIDNQIKINEPGAIYKCKFNYKSNENVKCYPFIFDPWGNFVSSINAYDSEKKDNRWLGAAMDSNANNNDIFAVCAPRLMSNVEDISHHKHYLMHGICYMITNTSGDQPKHIQKIKPLRAKNMQTKAIDVNKPKDKIFYYMFGEMGISVHVTENNEAVLIGAPGVYIWMGTVVRYNMVLNSTDVPTPLLRMQEMEDNSYFGFAVSSGYFNGRSKELLYVASAPRANNCTGMVYIFDINDNNSKDKSFEIYHKFTGPKFGEYFGYSLIAEDFNNDGLTDIAIGAPYSSESGNYDNGAVYIYCSELKNQRKSFVAQTILRTDYEYSGRFGTTMSKVGDLNNDGFNDLIVAAPFEENGAIYIYHGSAKGLSTKSSQKIIAPQSGMHLMPMFGHGLSKGVDIDGNNYMDIAVGSPNIDTVYIYRSYPIIRVITSITPEIQVLKSTDKSFKFKVCWMYKSAYPIKFDVLFNAIISLDAQSSNRTSFDNGKRVYNISQIMTVRKQCKYFTVSVNSSAADIYKPIDLEMSHTILNGMPNYCNDTENVSQEFCNTCVAVDPNDAKSVKNKVVFSTGCKAVRCVADLILQSSLENIPMPYILGSSSSLAIDYHVKNNGETAYLAQINITLANNDTIFTRIPSNCRLNDLYINTMECDLNNGLPMKKGGKTSLKIKIGIDAIKLNETELVIIAQVHSIGDESNESDNMVKDVIPLAEFSEIEVLGFSNTNDSRLTLDNTDQSKNVTYSFEIKNNGPSNIKLLAIEISLPISYINPATLEQEQFIKINSVSMLGTYNNEQYDVDWTKNNTSLNMNTIKSTASGEKPNFEELSRRKRESMSMNDDVQYDQGVVEARSSQFSLHRRNKRDIFSFKDELLADLPVNRTTYFDSKNLKRDQCLIGRLIVTNFQLTDAVISIVLNFTIDMDAVGKALDEKHDILVIKSFADLIRRPNKDKGTLKIVQRAPSIIILKYTPTPIWVYILSLIGGLLLMVLISYTMNKFGFFRRRKREKLVELKRKSRAMSFHPIEKDSDHQNDFGSSVKT